MTYKEIRDEINKHLLEIAYIISEQLPRKEDANIAERLEIALKYFESEVNSALK